MANILLRKPLDAILEETRHTGGNELKRVLGATNLVALGIGAIIGAGIFVLTGTAAAQYAGPAIVLSFILAGTGCLFAGLCYAEFASLIPIAGSAYTYGYATLGEIFAWIVGWNLVLEYAFGAATVASGWGANVLLLLQKIGLDLPPQLAATPGTDMVLYKGFWMAADRVPMGASLANLPHATGWFNIIAFFGICMVTVVLVIGIQESATLNTIIVFIKVGTVLVFIAVAAVYVLGHMPEAKANWTPFVPPNSGEFGKYGWSGVVRAAGVIFFAYIGFDAVSTAAQEAKNPKRDMPIGILGSLIICTVLYIATAGLLTGVVKYPQLNSAAPVAVGIMATGVQFGEWLVLIGSIMGLSTVMLVMLLGQSRVFYSMSNDGLLPEWAGRIHPKFRTPYISSILVGIFVAIFAATIPIGVLGELVSIGTLLAFVIVCAGVWILRRKRPELARPFRTPMVPLVPILGMLIALGLMAGLPVDTWLRLIIWLVIGMDIYLGYGLRHSHVQKAAGNRGKSMGGLGVAGLLAGGALAFLLRPATAGAPLSFWTVFTRGGNTPGADVALLDSAHTAFYYMVAAAVAGAAAGIFFEWRQTRKPAA
jgi:APA family basic amino acid/polyamine antiporter